jgi:hypothetical protein
MAARFEIASGWTAIIPFALKINGVMATSFSTQDVVELILRRPEGERVPTSGDVVLIASATSTYNCTYTPGPNDLRVAPNPYLARFKVTDGGGKVQYFPHAAADEWLIHSA